jgi:hypothetical protein
MVRSTSKTMALIGKYVFISTEDHYKYGQISECVDYSGGFFLINIWNSTNLLRGSSMYHVNQMVQDDNTPEGIAGWQFFKTKKELLTYVAWIEKPTVEKTGDGKVIKFIAK